MKHELLDVESTEYRKRLARAVNKAASTVGAYCNGRKVFNARYHGDRIEINDGIPTWNVDKFFDGYGREITASREQR